MRRKKRDMMLQKLSPLQGQMSCGGCLAEALAGIRATGYATHVGEPVSAGAASSDLRRLLKYYFVDTAVNKIFFILPHKLKQ